MVTGHLQKPRTTTGLLTSFHIEDVFHYAPLHYLVFIARGGALSSKDELRRAGFDISHFRRTSRGRDQNRGFSNYVHLTLDKHPPILKAKLYAGFPHFEVRMPAAHVESGTIHLCRYNIAMCRNHLHSKKPAPEGDATGRYHANKQIPTAETADECRGVLRANLRRNMVEVLVPNRLNIPNGASLVFFHEADRALADEMLRLLGVEWPTITSSEYPYTRAPRYVKRVEEFLRRAQLDPAWKGDGLDFDAV